MKKRVMCLLLCICLLAANSLPFAQAEEQSSVYSTPTLKVEVEYGESTQNGMMDAVLTLTCVPPGDGSAGYPAENIALNVTMTNGLRLMSGDQWVEFKLGKLACGASQQFKLKLIQDPLLEPEPEINAAGEVEPIVPVLEAFATSDNCGWCRYTCEFDITPDPRALLLGVNPSPYMQDAWMTQELMERVKEIFDASYYEKRAVQVFDYTADVSDPAAKDLMSSLAKLEGFDTKKNDITYVYIKAPGVSGGLVGKLGDADEIGTVAYSEIFDYIAETVEGRIAVIIDTSAASGTNDAIISAAQVLDPEDSVVLCADNTATERGGMSESWYQGMFTQALLSAAEGRRNSKHPVYAENLHVALTDSTTRTNRFILAIDGTTLHSKYYGNLSTPIFTFNPEHTLYIRILVPDKEELVVSPMELSVVIVTCKVHEYTSSNFEGYVVEPEIYANGVGSKEGIAAINQTLKEAAEYQCSEAADYMSWVEGDGCFYQWMLTDVYATQGAVSLQLATFGYTGGSHTIHGTGGYILSLEDGRELALIDMLNPENPEAADRLVHELSEAIASQYGSMLFGSAENVARSVAESKGGSWTLQEEGIVMEFTPGDIAPNSAGKPEVIVPYDDLEGVLADIYMPFKADSGGHGDIVSGSDQRFSSGTHTIYGAADDYAFAVDGTVSQVKAFSGNEENTSDRSVVFYASSLTNSIAWLPKINMYGNYIIRWMADGEEQALIMDGY